MAGRPGATPPRYKARRKARREAATRDAARLKTLLRICENSQVFLVVFRNYFPEYT
jgi:hypothetical protein